MLVSGLIILHALAAITWVGGLIFLRFVLHPASLELLPAQRVALMAQVLRRFFRLVWIAIAVLYMTGIALIVTLYGSMAVTPLPVHFMIGVAHAMTAVFLYVWFRPYAAFRRHRADGDEAAALAAGFHVRRWATANLALGLLASFLGAISPYVG